MIINKNDEKLNQCIVEFGGSLSKELPAKKLVLERIIDGNDLLIGNVLHINSVCFSYTNIV